MLSLTIGLIVLLKSKQGLLTHDFSLGLSDSILVYHALTPEAEPENPPSGSPYVQLFV